MRARRGAMLVCCAAMAAGACKEAQSVEVQPLPPLQRPSPEARAGLPEVRGLWRFAGFEIPAADTTLVREKVYALTPPGDFQIATQRLDSIAGQYLRAGVAFPIVGEVRRDSAVSLVLFSGGTGQFVAGHVRRDTLWVELTTFQSAVESWPRGTRAALVRRVSGPPFRRLLGGAPITVPVDSTRLDSLRMDSLRRAGVVVPPAGTQPAPGQPMPGAVPPAVQPGVPAAAQPQRPPVTQPQRPPATQPQRPPATQPQRPPVTQPQRPPATQPRPPAAQPRQPVQQRPPAQRPPPAPTPRETVPAPRPETPPPAPLPRPNAPRDTIRFPAPPR